LREVLRTLESLVGQDQQWDLDDARTVVYRLYGDGEPAWRGVRLRWALSNAEKAESDEAQERANEDFDKEAKQDIELVREELAVCELEQGPLSPAGEAARLLEAMGSRKWSWMRQREMFLRRAIDRKVQVLIELRLEANRAERRAAADHGTNPASGQGSEGHDGSTPSGGGGTDRVPNPESRTPNTEERGEISRGAKQRSAGLIEVEAGTTLCLIFSKGFDAGPWLGPHSMGRRSSIT
jgi:hypothetical protein